MDILIDKENKNFIKDINPYERFKNTQNGIFEFYMKYNQLKNIYRQGWLKVRIGLEHANKCESIADHSFSVALLALTIIEQKRLNLDTFKCIKMGIIHELGEIYAGDYTPYDNITKEEKHIKEKEAILKVLKSLDENNDFLELWNEYEKQETSEAIFIKNIDQLEFLLQACAYGYDAQYFKRSLNSITDPYCMEIAQAAVEASKGNKRPTTVG